MFDGGTPGIEAMEAYFPATWVRASDLERHHGVGGKYTDGLRMDEFRCVDEDEDAVSMALTVTRRLLRRARVDTCRVRHVVVGSESHPDVCTSIKTQLVRHLWRDATASQHAVVPVPDGGDVYNACFGGTVALMDALTYVRTCVAEDSDDLALVVATDISDATDEFPFMRGAAAVALLVGRRGRAVVAGDAVEYCVRNEWDFFKPLARRDVAPIMRAHDSIRAYNACLQECYHRLSARHGDRNLVDECDRVVLHLGSSPKFVQHAFEHLCSVAYGATGAAPERVRALFDAKVAPGLQAARRVGPMHTAAVYAALCYSLATAGERVLVFSYGSGSAACMFVVDVVAPVPTSTSLDPRVASCAAMDPGAFDAMCDRYVDGFRRRAWTPSTPSTPLTPPSTMDVADDDRYVVASVRVDGLRQYAPSTTRCAA